MNVAFIKKSDLILLKSIDKENCINIFSTEGFL